MNTATIARVDAGGQDRAYACLLLAFVADPVERWLYPQAQQYLAHFPTFLRAFGGGAIEAGTGWRLGDFAAVSLWLPPGTGLDGRAIVEVLTASVASAKHND